MSINEMSLIVKSDAFVKFKYTVINKIKYYKLLVENIFHVSKTFISNQFNRIFFKKLLQRVMK